MFALCFVENKISTRLQFAHNATTSGTLFEQIDSKQCVMKKTIVKQVEDGGENEVQLST